MVELRKIDADNYLKILGMELPSRQQSFVASNAVSLAQAWVFYDTAHPFAIYHDDEPVGFVMFDFGKGPREVEIWRFMIAPEHQGKGYGTAALRAAVAWLKEQNRFDRVRINYVEGNGAAQAVYRKVGFRETGEREGAEVVMTMPLACSADVPEGACVIDRETWERKSYWEQFTQQARCYASLTAQVDVTRLVDQTQKKGCSFYIALLYCVTAVVNRHREFRYAYDARTDRVLLWKEVWPSHLVFHDREESFTAIWSRWNPDFKAFSQNCREDIERGKKARGHHLLDMPPNTFDVTALPWLSYTSLDINLTADAVYLAPIISWGRWRSDGSRTVLPLSMEIHHAVADGFHIARFFREVEQLAGELKLG